MVYQLDRVRVTRPDSGMVNESDPVKVTRPDL